MRPCSSRRRWSAALLLLGALASAEDPKVLRAIQVAPGNPSSVTTYAYPFDLFSLLFGSPPRNLSVQISTSSSEIWLPAVSACEFLGGEEVCDTPNSYDPTGPNGSETWRSVSDERIQLSGGRGREDIEYMYEDGTKGGVGYYGYERVSFGAGGGDSGGREFVSEVPVALVNISMYHENVLSSTAEIGVGMVGLGQAEWDHEGTRRPSLLWGLKEREMVGARYYGYTPGCGKCGSRGSLTLGGYNAARMPKEEEEGWNEAVFALNAYSQPELLLNEIRVIKTSTGDAAWDDEARPTTLLHDSILATIDSSTPYLWLPTSVCTAFTSAFNLTYRPLNNLTGTGQHLLPSSLSFSDLSLTFSLASRNTDTTPLGPLNSTTLTIPLPLLTFPDPTNDPSNPDRAVLDELQLKCSEDKDTFTLGRAWLQNFYLRTDYSRATFSVLPVIHSAETQLVPVEEGFPISPDKLPVPHSAALSKGAIIGIAIGGAVLLLSIAALIAFYLRRSAAKRKAELDATAYADNKPPLAPHAPGYIPHKPLTPTRSTANIPSHPLEMDGVETNTPLGSERRRAELGGMAQGEMEGSPGLAPTEYRDEKGGQVEEWRAEPREEGPRVKFLQWWRG